MPVVKPIRFRSTLRAALWAVVVALVFVVLARETGVGGEGPLAGLLGIGGQPQPEGATGGHKGAEGSWKYTNRLAGESSPYLLQHAHNPVDWYPWGPEALERAREENRPIFLSVGYSTCYWCHVMERETFENEEIARLMNERFINIKVDREERPDLDEIYMTATQLMTRHGGWPNSVFLTPELKPFFTGTYFGPVDQAGRPGFGTVVTQLGDAWVNERERVREVAEHVAEAIRSVTGERLASIPRAALDRSIVDRAVAEVGASYDPKYGGFGVAPKFPSDFHYSFLLDVHERRRAAGQEDAGTAAMVKRTLDAMAAGGIHDHVGGGFHRYATDAQWKVPHFEKMLYNQAHLAVAYLDAYGATGDEEYARVARGIFRFVGEVFTGPPPHGQFYSALDAETDAVEGAYYVWAREQVRGVLGKPDAERFLSVFELAPVPIFPGHKHPDGGTLVRKAEPGTGGLPTRGEVDAMLAELASARKARELPRLDDKAIAAWNGMMIDAYVRGAEVLGDEAYLGAAERGAEFVLGQMRTPDGRLLRSVRLSAAGDGDGGAAPHEGFLEDYAFMIRAVLSLHRITGEARWLAEAEALTAKAGELFWDAEAGGYLFATPSADLIARGKDLGDNATPGGNSVMAHNLVALHEATGDTSYRRRADELLTAFSGVLSQSPRGSVHMVHALDHFLSLPDAPAAARGVEIKPPPAEEPGAALAGATDSSAHVKAEAAIEPREVAPGGTFRVRIALDIAPGWHINANPASLDFLIPTSVDVRPAGPAPGEGLVEVTGVEYPEARSIRLAGEEIRVYEGRAEIVATVRLGAGAEPGVLPVRIITVFQACDDAACLAPAEQIMNAQVQVARPSDGPGGRGSD